MTKIYILFDKFVGKVKAGEYRNKGIYWNKRLRTACYSDSVKMFMGKRR